MTKKQNSPFEFNSWRDLTPLNSSVGSTLDNKTGSWRFIKPYFEDKMPACQNACRAGSDIEGWIKLLQQGRYTDAYWHLKQEQPFPAILGRVCYRFCETGCNRNVLDDSVRINHLERFIGDRVALSEPYPIRPEKNGKSLAVIGSGPAGMANAYFTALLGFDVTIFESLPVMGGILRVGIPDYRLPREIIDLEFKGLENMGITLKPGVTIGKDVSYDQLTAEFDYVFLATGVHSGLKLGIPGEDDSQRVMSGLEFLKQIALNQSPQPGKHVLVVGGGNTAIDTARSALRLGAEATVVYRRTESEMPAHEREFREAKEEGVRFQFLSTPERIDLDSNGNIEKVVCQEMELGSMDDSGRRRPVKKEGAFVELAADLVLNAIGERADLTYLDEAVNTSRGVVPVDDALRMYSPGANGARIYAGGDIIDNPHTVVHAVASGKRAAIAMDCNRKGLSLDDVLQNISIGCGPAISFSRYVGWKPVNPVYQNNREVVEADNIVFDYYRQLPAIECHEENPDNRVRDFTPYMQTYTESEMREEVQRCMHCGRCSECDNCVVFCPDMSVRFKDDNRFGYNINYDYCKGCGICYSECPRNAISMLQEKNPIPEEV